MYFQNLLDYIKDKRVETFLGMCVIALIMFGASVKDVASGVLAIFVIYSFFYLSRMKMTWQSFQKREKLMFTGFVLYTLSGFLAYINVEDTYEWLKEIDRYMRFTFIIPVFMAITYSGIELKKYFYMGVVLSGPAYLYFAINSVMENPTWPANGYYHHIMFGSAATVNAMLMLLMLVLEKWNVKWKVLVFISMSCALYASILSQSRGAWVFIPIGVLISVIVMIREKSIKARYSIAVFFMLLMGVLMSPAGDIVESRYQTAVNEIELFVEKGDASTSNGGRLALWDISIRIWQENILIGTGPGDFDNDLMKYQEEGIYPELITHSSVHNIYLQALSSTGIIGLVVLVFSLVLLPIFYFFDCIQRNIKFAYYGFMFIAAYAVFGLTESWILRAPAVSIYIVVSMLIMTVSHVELKGER